MGESILFGLEGNSHQMQPRVLVFTVAALLFCVAGMAFILNMSEGTLSPTTTAGGPAVVPDDRSTADLIANTTTLAIKGDLQTLYQVKKGDTLFGISRKFDVSVQAIKDANKDKRDMLAVGQWLAIPK